jgi:two-component system nitrogen regulation sensor histidine kinase NtrY
MIEKKQSSSRRFKLWFYKSHISQKVSVWIIALSVLAVIATIGIFAGFPPLGPKPSTVIIIVAIDSILLLSLSIIVFKQIIELWVKRKKGINGTKLYSRLVILFSLIAVSPSVILVTLSTVFFNFGIEQWFTKRVTTALQESLEVADAYLQEHRNAIRGDALGMANDLGNQATLLVQDANAFSKMVQGQMGARGISETLIFDSRFNIIARGSYTFTPFVPNIPEATMRLAREGAVIVLKENAADTDRVYALVKIPNFVDSFLYVGRPVDPRAVYHVQKTRETVEAYQQVERHRTKLQIAISFLIIVMALLLLLAAVWVGLLIAHRLLMPIAAMADAAEKIAQGNFEIKIPLSTHHDELRTLTVAFNRMAGQLSTQRQKLVDTNDQLDSRRRFMEAVLAGVSAGVIGLDEHGNVQAINPRALSLLGKTGAGDDFGAPIDALFPECLDLLKELYTTNSRIRERQITIIRGNIHKTLFVRVAAEYDETDVVGYVITYDDMTDFIRAEKTAAWSDVARRLAHEIKNPLTPIQLSAERLERRFLKQITPEEGEVFSQCTRTIIRQVEDLQRLVDEFSSFARMPTPKKIKEDFTQLCRDMLALQQSAHPKIKYVFEAPDAPLLWFYDGGMMRQALINLLKNAAEAIEEKKKLSDFSGKITLTCTQETNSLTLTLDDNGNGLTQGDPEKLLEPYVTTKTKGTGLGLAIVKKIVEEHDGILKIEARQPHGVRVTLLLKNSTL